MQIKCIVFFKLISTQKYRKSRFGPKYRVFIFILFIHFYQTQKNISIYL